MRAETDRHANAQSDTLGHFGSTANMSGHFSNAAEVFCYRSVMIQKSPVTPVCLYPNSLYTGLTELSVLAVVTCQLPGEN